MFTTKNSAVALSAIVAIAGNAMGQETVYGITDTGNLVSWDSGDSSNILSGVAVQGLQSNERLRGIDFRPANGQLYGLGSFNNLYTIDQNSGQATLVGAGNFGPGMNGSSFGFDFNPVIDRIRVVSDANQNLVLNPNDGTSTQVTDLFYAMGDVNFGADPSVVSSAYTNSFAGAATTQLYGIDTELDILVTQANSAGTLGTVGALGIDLNDTASFDISGSSGIAYGTVVSEDGSQSIFWTVDLATGATTMLGQVGGGSIITSMAVVPAPGGLALLGIGAAAGVRRRRS